MAALKQQSSPASSSPSSPVRVVIVGAGFAGLACARALARDWPRRGSAKKLEIVLLEASSDGVGGRARAASLPRTGAVELGCTWLHGAVAENAAFAFYQEEQARDVVEKLPELRPNEQQEQQQQQRWRMELLRPGEKKPLSGAERATAIATMAAFGEAIDAAAEDEELLKEPDATVGDALRRRFDELVSEEAKAAKGGNDGEGSARRHHRLLSESWACRERLHRAYDGFRSSDDAGAAFAADYQELEGEHLPVPGGGYAALARRLLKAAQREVDDDGGGKEEEVSLRVRLGCPVERIEWGGAGDDDAAKPRARVVLESKEEEEGDGPSAAAAAAVEEADAVVVTVSLGVLQARAMMEAESSSPPPRPLFSPPLPERKQRALRLMRIGVIDKLFFEWEDEAIPEEGEEESGSGESDDNDEDKDDDTQPQPFPMVCHEEEEDDDGRGKDQQAAAAAAAADDTVGPRKTHTTTAAAAASSSSSASSAAATSWCFLWPSENGAEWGAAGRPSPSDRPPFSVGAALERAAAAAAAAGAAENASTAAAATAARRDAAQRLARTWMDADAAVFGDGKDDNTTPLSVPRWLRGLHSLRFSDGPEWIRGAGGDGDDEAALSAIAQARSEGAACVIWATSAAALHSETLTDEELRLEAWPALLKAFPALEKAAGGGGGKGRRRLMLRRPPSAVARSKWGTDPRFHGSYSYPGPGATGAEAEALAEPLGVVDAAASAAPQPVVLFAGEHTSRRFMGTVHGAMESGEREAARLVEVLGRAA